MPDITVSVAFLFSCVSVIGVVVSILNTNKKNQEAEKEKELSIERNFVKVNLKLDTLCDQITSILKKQEKDSDSLGAISEKLTRFEVQINEHERRIEKLEKGES